MKDCRLLCQRFAPCFTSPSVRTFFERWTEEVADLKLQMDRVLPVEIHDTLIGLMEARHTDSEWMTTR